jgi:lysozyme family protein
MAPRSAARTAEQARHGGSGVIDEMIRERAYEISQSDDAGSAEENWERAVREIRAEAVAED